MLRSMHWLNSWVHSGDFVTVESIAWSFFYFNSDLKIDLKNIIHVILRKRLRKFVALGLISGYSFWSEFTQKSTTMKIDKI